MVSLREEVIPLFKKNEPMEHSITAYGDVLLSGLDRLDWTESIKEIQRNWIGKSERRYSFF